MTKTKSEPITYLSEVARETLKSLKDLAVKADRESEGRARVPKFIIPDFRISRDKTCTCISFRAFIFYSSHIKSITERDEIQTLWNRASLEVSTLNCGFWNLGWKLIYNFDLTLGGLCIPTEVWDVL